MGLQSVQGLLDNAVSGLFPKETVGIGGFETFARVRERTLMTSDITTNYVEDGSPISDHVILKPLRLSIEGNVGDVYLTPSPSINAFRRAQAEIGNITQYAPLKTQAQISRASGLANNVADGVRRIDALIATGNQAYNFLTGKVEKPLGEQFLDLMEMYWKGKFLFSVDMPYRQYANMGIVSLEVTRDNTHAAIAFTLEVQEVRFAESIFAELTAKAAPALNGALSPVKDKGTQKPPAAQQSAAHYMVHGSND